MRFLFAISIIASILLMKSFESEVSSQPTITKTIKTTPVETPPAVSQPGAVIAEVEPVSEVSDPIDNFWDEQREHWEGRLFELIDWIDPENVVSILRNYHEERRRHNSVTGRLVKIRASNRVWDLEYDLYESNLRRIFREHYDAVKADHDEFNESIRYSHPQENIEIAIGL